MVGPHAWERIEIVPLPDGIIRVEQCYHCETRIYGWQRDGTTGTWVFATSYGSLEAVENSCPPSEPRDESDDEDIPF